MLCNKGKANMWSARKKKLVTLKSLKKYNVTLFKDAIIEVVQYMYWSTKFWGCLLRYMWGGHFCRMKKRQKWTWVAYWSCAPLKLASVKGCLLTVFVTGRSVLPSICHSPGHLLIFLRWCKKNVPLFSRRCVELFARRRACRIFVVRQKGCDRKVYHCREEQVSSSGGAGKAGGSKVSGGVA